MQNKVAYICGPLTELAETVKQQTKELYSLLGDICQEELGLRAFVPHEHYDPDKHAHFSPNQVDTAERRQVCENTSVLVVVALEPTWGGGIEVEMAYRSGVPVIILKPPKNVSRLLRGNPAIREIVEFTSPENAVENLRLALRKLGLPKGADDLQMQLAIGD